ncbi:ABC transporter C family member 8-like protein [Tanacetum coccineum]
MLVIKRFSERKKVFRERKKTGKIRAKRSTSKPDTVYRCHFLVLLPKGYIPPGLVGLSLSYALALTNAHVFLTRWYCGLANYVISVERIKQYMHIPPEPPAVVEKNRPPSSWPSKVFDGAFGGEGEEDVVMGEGVVVTSSSLEMLTNSCLDERRMVDRRRRKKKWGDNLFSCYNPFKSFAFVERLKGIKREYSNARTPQQNGVAERKNKTLIEAARTMLADSFLPNTFWAEAVSTACYVVNRY